ncbi:hypothetical protein HMI56_000124 [Coelomomyces lativittatus]|nr:hypothetical protein HMI56_000124 [Coelomomyces lativittatus]
MRVTKVDNNSNNFVFHLNSKNDQVSCGADLKAQNKRYSKISFYQPSNLQNGFDIFIVKHRLNSSPIEQASFVLNCVINSKAVEKHFQVFKKNRCLSFFFSSKLTLEFYLK